MWPPDYMVTRLRLSVIISRYPLSSSTPPLQSSSPDQLGERRAGRLISCFVTNWSQSCWGAQTSHTTSQIVQSD